MRLLRVKLGEDAESHLDISLCEFLGSDTPHMRSSHTDGETKRYSTPTWQHLTGLSRETRKGIRNWKQLAVLQFREDSSIFGAIPAVSTKPPALSSPRPSTQCTTTTLSPLDASPNWTMWKWICEMLVPDQEQAVFFLKLRGSREDRPCKN